MNTKKNVILGTGQLGLAVMEELVGRGREVRLINRSGKVNEPLPQGVTVGTGYLTDAATVAALCADADVVFHIAQPGYTEWAEKFPPLTRAILDGVAQTNARLVVADNLYMYGPTGGAPIHEALPYAATGVKGRVRAQVAEMVLAAHRAGHVQATLARASDFYGPRVTSSALGDRFWLAALAGKTADVLGNPDLPHTYTYIRDFARAMVTLSEQPDAFGRAWHAPSAPTVSTREFAAMVGSQIGRPVKLRAAGRLMVRLVGLFNPLLREFNELMYEFDAPYIVDHSQFAQQFGSRTTPHAEAIAETLAWYRANPVAHG